MTVVWVALGAAVGAPTRYLLDRAVQARHRTGFPWGTFGANLLACTVLGLVSGLVTAGIAGPAVAALVGTGFCGALSTYSTFSYETARLAEDRRWFAAAVNVVVSVAAGLGAVAVGVALAAL